MKEISKFMLKAACAVGAGVTAVVMSLNFRKKMKEAEEKRKLERAVEAEIYAQKVKEAFRSCVKPEFLNHEGPYEDGPVIVKKEEEGSN